MEGKELDEFLNKLDKLEKETETIKTDRKFIHNLWQKKKYLMWILR